MVTGDAQRTAQAIGGELGVTDIFADVLPAGKVDVIRQLQADGSLSPSTPPSCSSLRCLSRLVIRWAFDFDFVYDGG
jgi:hypothetical protein